MKLGMNSKEFSLKFEKIRALIKEKIESNKDYHPQIEFIENIACYSTPVESISKNLNKTDEEVYFDTIIIPAIPRSLKTEKNLDRIQCRFSYSQKCCNISPTTHYDILNKIFKYETSDIKIFIDRFCLRKLIDFYMDNSNSDVPEILISTLISLSDEGNIISDKCIKILPINIKEGFPSVGFQLETYLTKSEVDLGPSPLASLKLIDSCFVIDKIKFGELILIRRCELDAVRRSHIYGTSIIKKEQEAYKDSLKCERWNQEIISYPSKDLNYKLNPPCKVIISDNLKLSKISPENRVEIKSISCRNTHNFSWVSVYFQMLIGCTPFLIRGCHNRGFFTQNSICSYKIEQVKEFSDKELLAKNKLYLDFSETNWDKITLSIAFSEAILEYIKKYLIKDIASYIFNFLGSGDHHVNITMRRKDDEIIFELLDDNNFPNIPGPINEWRKYIKK